MAAFPRMQAGQLDRRRTIPASAISQDTSPGRPPAKRQSILRSTRRSLPDAGAALPTVLRGETPCPIPLPTSTRLSALRGTHDPCSVALELPARTAKPCASAAPSQVQYVTRCGCPTANLPFPITHQQETDAHDNDPPRAPGSPRERL